VRKFRTEDEDFHFDADEEDMDDHDDEHDDDEHDYDGHDDHDDEAHEHQEVMSKEKRKAQPTKKKTLSLEEILETEDQGRGRRRHL
jgi:hypothetical protein